jgi:Ca2+-binding RTX toxin-like protein
MVTGGGMGDSIDGGADEDTLWGNSGSDTLDGGDHDDVLFGGTDNDTLRGGSGNDVLNGDEGDDFLDGGAGNDILTGHQGTDTFVFAPTGTSGTDTVTDFTLGDDRIDVSAFGFNSIFVLGMLLQQSDQDVVMRLSYVGGDDLILEDLSLLELSVDDFIT